MTKKKGHSTNLQELFELIKKAHFTKKLYIPCILFFLFMKVQVYSQSDSNYIWWNPATHSTNTIEGQGWPNNVVSTYDRLPKKAENTVREDVWNLSQNAAGLLIRFSSNAENIKIRYKIKEDYIAMSHMPATGVSGLDLYSKSSDGKWLWNQGKFSFGDTIQYHYKNIVPKESYHKVGSEYHLYLPLYNSLEWLEIGVLENDLFKPLALRKEKPIVVYGTSIAQGGCASRPGMAWTSILERKMDRPLINLGFSGNGRLEEELIDLICEIDAKIYVLDCLPNLKPNKTRSLEDVGQRIISAVKKIRKNHPTTPILLVEHPADRNGATNMDLDNYKGDLNRKTRETISYLKDSGVTNIHLLSKAEINLNINDFVDGNHPSDMGMMKYALAYEKSIRKIIHEPIGDSSTTIPVTQNRDADVYDWQQRHQKLLQVNKENPPKICLIGDSITHYWGGNSIDSLNSGEDSWGKITDTLSVGNFGFGWDYIENALWRVYHDELDGFEAEQVVIMIGTNNLETHSDKEIIEGLEILIQAIVKRQPNAKILLAGILPRQGREEQIHNLNITMSQLASSENINFENIGRVLLNENDKIEESLFLDGLHPNANGYDKLALTLKEYLLSK